MAHAAWWLSYKAKLHFLASLRFSKQTLKVFEVIVFNLFGYSLFLLKSPTSDKRWHDNVFISGGNPHLTSQFCGVVLEPITISKMLSESPPRSVGPPVSSFCYRVIQHLCPCSTCPILDVKRVCQRILGVMENNGIHLSDSW